VALFRSEVMTQFGDFAGALALMQSASQLDPTCPLPYVNAGRAFTAMGDLASARKHLLKAEQVSLTVYFCIKVQCVELQLSRVNTHCSIL
jgi:uncharacterized protein HemY